MNNNTNKFQKNLSEMRIHCTDDNYNHADSKIFMCIRFSHKKALNVPKRIQEFMELIRTKFDE